MRMINMLALGAFAWSVTMFPACCDASLQPASFQTGLSSEGVAGRHESGEEKEVAIDFHISSDADEELDGALFRLTTDVINRGKKKLKNLRVRYIINLQPTLYTATPRAADTLHAWVEDTLLSVLPERGRIRLSKTINLEHARFWSPEEPWLYRVKVMLLDKNEHALQTLETASGIRKSRFSQTLSLADEYGHGGRFYILNTQPFKIKGLRWTDLCNSNQNLTVAIKQLKHLGANTIVDDADGIRQDLYKLCDLYGLCVIRIQDTARISKADSLLSNHPSLCMWATPYVKASREKVLVFTPTTQRYQMDENTAYIALSDTISPIYMSQAMQHAIDAKPGEGYPYLMACVCANDTAEVVTRMADISKAIDQTNLIMGQLLICDALPIGNLAKALQKNFQDVTIDSINGPEGYFAIANNNYFVTLSHYTALWQVWEGDQVKAQGTLTVPSLQPRGRVTVKVPFDKSKMLSRHTYTVRLSFRLKHKLPWAEEGEVMASHDFYIMLK